MAITIDGDGTITGVSVGGLPDGIVAADMLAANAVTTAKISDSQITEAKLASDPQQGVAKMWVNFTGTGTVAINDSFNVASITDNGTGDYTITFTNAMANANYAIVGEVKSSGPSNTRGAEGTQIDDATDPSTTAFRVQTLFGSSGSADGDTFDPPRVYFVVFGD